MSGWKAKRFWQAAAVTKAECGHGIALDGRPLQTPGKRALIVPTRALAQAIAAEWDAQQGQIDPRSMPLTRAANAALDKVAAQHAEVVALIADYGATDHLCYRAEAPQALQACQCAAWDPLLDWAAAAFDVRLNVTQGIAPVAQDAAALARLAALVGQMDAFELVALYDLVGITGSLVLGLAVVRGHIGADAAWQLARIDEDWQAAQWGEDDEAAAQAALRRGALLVAAKFWRLVHASH
jgi:chaperone required for assembly of F1-ATPase